MRKELVCFINISVHGFPDGGALRIGHQKMLKVKNSLYICSEEESQGGGELPKAAYYINS